MSAKDSITTQTCEISQEEFNNFLALYPVPSEYHVILPKSNQTVFDAPPGYVGLYTHSFSLENLRLPLIEFFCEVLEYFQVYISRLDPFGCAKLTTFVVICKAYGCEPSVDLFRGFFNLCRADSIIPAKYPQLLPEQNKLDLKSFKDKLPPNIEENPMFQRLSRYPTSPIEVIADSGGIPKPELFVIHPGSLASGSFTSRATRAKTSSSKEDAPFLTISDDDEGLPDVLELKDANACHLKISAITPLA
ncbi:hypothetical protein Tco_1043579 [Tanacetum coccineum]|uniref:Transposase (putative) gypsy type domain-containing protein n=1 Tax=Tanacetum coccineum TaxID=301880 RepID=A0ABQ5GN00_9ASTR